MLDSGEKIKAEIIITATGIELNTLNDIKVMIDDQVINAHDRLTYRGMMMSGVPNLLIFWLCKRVVDFRADLTCEYVCRLINLMDKKGVASCTPIDDENAYGNDELIDFTSGYVQRASI